MYRIALVDDDLNHLDIFRAYIERYKGENEIEIELVTFSSGLAFISDYQPVYDILFLDIEMPHMNGMEVAKSVRKSDPHSVIVFITNMPQYAIKGYEVNAFDYMMKPLEYSVFKVKFDAVINAVEGSDEFSMLIPWKDGSRLVKADEIIYVEIWGHLLSVKTKDETYQMSGTLKEIEDQLKNQHFIRCNKSYLINLQYVIRMSSDIVVLLGGYELKISRSRRKEVQFAFIDYYSERKW